MRESRTKRPLHMSGKIFRSIFLVSLAVMLTAIIITSGVLYHNFCNRLQEEQIAQTRYLAYGMEQYGVLYLEHLPETETRITWVSAQGEILYDNRVTTETLSNHLDREEIRTALENGVGSVSRYSSTLSHRTSYYAIRLTDGTVLRTATRHDTLPILVFRLYPHILVLLAGILLIAGLLASGLAQAIVKPISRLNPRHPESASFYEELRPVVERLSAQNRKISKQLEELRARQTEFDAITSHMREGMIIIDRRAEILSCNASALQMLEFRGKLPKSVLMLNPREEFRHAVGCALTGKNGQETIRKEDVCYRILATPVLTDGEIAGAVLLILDDTEKEHRETLRREFTSNVSHELKTPLTSISGFAELIRSGMTSPEDTVHFADNIYREAQRLIMLVSDILRLSRLDDGKISYDTELIALDTLAADTAERLAPLADAAKLRLETEIAHAQVLGNRQILEEIVFNLCDNAIKYNQPGGWVRIQVHLRGKHPELIVSDNGIGIPKEQQERVFERFYRVDKSHSKEVGGTGLGLSIVKHGAAFHHAELRLESEPGKGTSVCITFPEPSK